MAAAILLHITLISTCAYASTISNSSLACGVGDCQADAESSESDTSFLQVRGAVRNTATEGIISRFVTGRAQPAKKNNAICMQMAEGCSGSSFIAKTVYDLIHLHGVLAWTPNKELLAPWEMDITGQTFCTDLSGKEHKWDRDPHKRLPAAWNILSGNVTCRPQPEFLSQTKPTVLFFDGHLPWSMIDAMPFLQSVGASRAHVYGLKRTNALEKSICLVRDCWGLPQIGQVPWNESYPVFLNGTKRDELCFKRRSLNLSESEYKVYLDPAHLRWVLETDAPVWEQTGLKNALNRTGFAKFAVASLETLVEYEYDNSTAALNGSADEFAKILRSMDIVADMDLIKKHLNSAGRGTRTRHNVTAAIHNVEEVRQALVGTNYEGSV